MPDVITWTKTDETPALSSMSLLPVMRHFLQAADVGIHVLDISLAGRILQAFPESVEPEQIAALGMDAMTDMVHKADANIIKLPNASATVNQLKDAIDELRSKGFNIPKYPDNPKNEGEEAIKARYDAQTGSVVNPPLRQGNAVRSIPKAVKEAAQENPHQISQWTPNSKTRIAHMDGGDFYDTEKSMRVPDEQAGKATIRFRYHNGQSKTLMTDVELKSGDVIDTAFMDIEALQGFLQRSYQEAKDERLVASLHLKATMMKKTDGQIFGRALAEYLRPILPRHGDKLEEIGVDATQGLDNLFAVLAELEDEELRDEILADIEECMSQAPEIAMANMREGTNHLSSPNNVIADVSLANLARWGGEVQDKDGHYRDTLAILPDSTYARMHQAGIDFLKQNGSPDPVTLGSVKTVRLQAEGAEEYGSKDTTFEADADGFMEIVSESGQIIASQQVSWNSMWRLCRTTQRAVENWIDLALQQERPNNEPVIFWLDENRAHDQQIIEMVEKRISELGVNHIEILSPADAMTLTLERSYNGKDTICVTGNLIGDHITDYFPILEIGSSSKMLSVIKLLNGGLVAETGSGGTAPDLLGMLAERNQFLWDDTGTAFAMVEALKHLHSTCQNTKALVMAQALEAATTRYIQDDRGPKPGVSDGRASHFYLTLYWAQELAKQSDDPELQSQFGTLADRLGNAQDAIFSQMSMTKGHETDTEGRYHPDPEAARRLMRPSSVLNGIIPDLEAS